jgi:hypothetical protein
MKSSRASSRAKKRRTMKAPPPWLSVVLLLLAVVALVLVLLSGRERISFPGLFRRQVESGSLSTFEEIREMARLETLAYVRRSVFPHDFLQPHLTVPGLLRTVAAAGTTAAEALQPEELAHLRAANLASVFNLAQTRNDERFVVVTTTLIFGYDLERIASDLESLLSESPAPAVYTLPPPALLSVITENVSRANYPYPAIPLDAQGWRQVTSFVEDHVTITAPMQELMHSAARNGRDAILSLLGREESVVEILLPDNIFFSTP